LTEDEPNFPEKLLYIHENNALPEDIPKITPHEIVQLKSVVDRMQGREDVPEEPPNPIDGSYRTMSQEHVPPYSGLFFADPASHVGFGYLEYNEISNPKSLL
jgi:hypothetical protein